MTRAGKKRGARKHTRPAGDIREFLVARIAAESPDPTAEAVKKFGVQRVTAYYHLRQLVSQGRVRKTGSTRDARWLLVEAREHRFARNAAQLNDEFALWQEEAERFFEGLQQNVLSIVRHGFTEMVNNVIDHSSFELLDVLIARTDSQIELRIKDDGVGIFRKIQNALSLSTPIEGIVELHKGKFTTDQARHSGEGIFFTSRMFDRFEILSGRERYLKDNLGDDWFLGELSTELVGTEVRMTIRTDSPTRREDVFRAFTTETSDGLASFNSTEVLVSLVTHGMSDLVSRSQAKRVLAGLEKFKRIILDFRGITSVGQGFADEVLRVFPTANRETGIEWRNANPSIEFMLRRSLASKS